MLKYSVALQFSNKVKSWRNSTRLQNYLYKNSVFTSALWLNLLSLHFTTAPGPPNGIIGLLCRSRGHTLPRHLQIQDGRLLLIAKVLAILCCRWSCIKRRMTFRIVASQPAGIVQWGCWFLGFLFFFFFFASTASAFSRKEKKNLFFLSMVQWNPAFLQQHFNCLEFLGKGWW